MSRSLLIRGLVVLVSMTGIIVGCSDSKPEGDLPTGRNAEPGELDKFQKDLEAKKDLSGLAPKRPPGVTLPPRPQ